MKVFRKILAVLLPILVLVAGFGVFRWMKETRPVAQKKEATHTAPLVRVESVESVTRPAVVVAKGLVRPARQVMLQSQVPGRLEWHHAQLVPGGLVKEGEVLVKLDGRDYQLNIAAQQASLKQAEMNLELEQGRRTVAEKEFALFGGEMPTTEEGRSLLLRAPQLESAEAGVAGVRSTIAQNRLNLSRGTLQAPFNAMVQVESVELGQLVQPATQLATLVGTDTFWVQVSVPLADVEWISIPGVNAAEGSPVEVVQRMGSEEVRRAGRVLRLTGEVDPAGQMAQVLVEVDDPLNLRWASEGAAPGLPMLLGSLVDVRVQGRELRDVVKVPRSAVRGSDEVWVYSGGKLEIRRLEVAWREADVVLVRGGLKAGEQLVMSRLAAPVEGMELRLPEERQPEKTEKTAQRAPGAEQKP